MAKPDPVLRVVRILTLLQQETAPGRGMSVRRIAEILREKDGTPTDPRSVRACLNAMIGSGLPIEGSGKYWYKGVFTAGEAEYLSLAVQDGTGLTQEQREQMLRKLDHLSGKAGAGRTAEQRRMPENSEMLSTLELLRTAISAGKQVSFRYGELDIGAELRAYACRNRKERIYNVSPYRLCFVNGRYYLLGATDRHRELTVYRVDRIMNAALRRAAIRPLAEKIPDNYLQEHPYMFSGPVSAWRLRVCRKDLKDVYDRFGTELAVENTDQKETDVLVRSDPDSMEVWLSRYGGIVRSSECLGEK